MPKLTEQELQEQYDQMLDEVYGNHEGVIELGFGKYEPSRIWKAIDEIAYELGMHDYADSLMRDGYEIEGY